MRVFVSHGSQDQWVAKQMARCIADIGCGTFLDAHDIDTGDDFETRIKDGLEQCDELLAFFSPFAVRRAWVFMEIGAAWMREKRVSAVLHGLTLSDLDGESGPGAGLLSRRHVRDLNDFDRYLDELKQRCGNGR